MFGRNYSFDSYNRNYGKYIIIANILLFIIIKIFQKIGLNLIFVFAINSFEKKFIFIQLFSYPFIHIGLWELIINMLMFYFFALPLEDYWGSKRFVRFYVYITITIGLIAFCFSFFSGYFIFYGISAFLFAAFTVYGFLFPENIVYILGLFPMKMKYAVYMYAGIEMLMVLSNTSNAVVPIIHLFGAILGIIYLKNENIGYFMGKILSIFNVENIKKHIEKRNLDNLQKLDMEVDRILEKISKNGIHSLTSREKKILEKKRKLSRKGY